VLLINGNATQPLAFQVDKVKRQRNGSFTLSPGRV